MPSFEKCSLSLTKSSRLTDWVLALRLTHETEVQCNFWQLRLTPELKTFYCKLEYKLTSNI